MKISKTLHQVFNNVLLIAPRFTVSSWKPPRAHKHWYNCFSDSSAALSPSLWEAAAIRSENREKKKEKEPSILLWPTAVLISRHQLLLQSATAKKMLSTQIRLTPQEAIFRAIFPASFIMKLHLTCWQITSSWNTTMKINQTIKPFTTCRAISPTILEFFIAFHCNK